MEACNNFSPEDKNNTSAFFSEDKDYPVSAVISALASQCGFGGAVNFETAVEIIPYKYLAGKTCRSVLELLSQAACGTWFCNNINQLEFKSFGTVTDYCTLDDNNCSEFRRGSVKVPFPQFRCIILLRTKTTNWVLFKLYQQAQGLGQAY